MEKIVFIIGMLFILGCGSSDNNSIKEEKRGLIVPIYFYDLNKWQDVVNVNIDEIAIINPSNGPGSNIDENYVNFIDDLVKNNKSPIGYVYTKWGNRDISEVENDIDTWMVFYPNIKGFFIDEAATGLDKFEYYKDLANYIKSKGNYYA